MDVKIEIEIGIYFLEDWSGLVIYRFLLTCLLIFLSFSFLE